MLCGILNICLKAFSPFWKPWFQLLTLEAVDGVQPFPAAQGEDPSPRTGGAEPPCTCCWWLAFAQDMQHVLSLWLTAWELAKSLTWHPSGSNKVERVWEGWQRHLLLSLQQTKPVCCHFIAIKMSTITAGSAAWGGGGDLLEITWGRRSQNQCGGTGTTESTASHITSKSAFWES